MSLTVNDLMDVYKITFGVRNNWRNVLLLLGVNNTTIDSIGVRWRENPDDCYREGILEWLKGGNRSWRDLMVALSGPIVGHNDIAKAIERHRIQRRGECCTDLDKSEMVFFLSEMCVLNQI